MLKMVNLGGHNSNEKIDAYLVRTIALRCVILYLEYKSILDFSLHFGCLKVD